ncbi:MAG: hypothetical protein ACR2L3_01250 [Actinomycetota bacterium]
MGDENEDVRAVPPDDRDEPFTGEDPGQEPGGASGPPSQDEPPAPGGTIPPRD